MSVTDVETVTGDKLPAIVTPDGVTRFLGVLPNVGGYQATPYASANPVIDRRDWIEIARRRRDVPILNQGGVGSCNAHGATSTVMKARAKSGQAFQLLSASYLYALINGGRDAGSMPEDAAKAIGTNGLCLDSEVPEGFYVARQVAKYAETAKRFRVDGSALYQMTTFDELGSAILLGFDCWYTVLVAGNWNRFDANGSPPAFRGYGNHVTSDDDGLKRLPSGEWVIPTRNSWGTAWGDDGRYNYREAHCENQPGFVAYGLKYPGQDPLDPNLAPIAA